ncbi:c-Myc-binding protein-like [Daktulosphaira vitifoliae]|uniref:c-Myc-binding protein-like n=1 Tax=Daktulosphaira vitifoliae TaxID=58002 RepID=UPI0021AAC8F7|nr:c-Myc-binding protein-like [Daktulosphaira vitifoliae]
MENFPVKDKDFYLNSGKSYSDKKGHLSRRAEFRRYLDKTGVLNKLTELMIDIYENPDLNFPITEYIRKGLLDVNPDEEEIKKLRPSLEEAKAFKEFLAKENRALKTTFRQKGYPLPPFADIKQDKIDYNLILNTDKFIKNPNN